MLDLQTSQALSEIKLSKQLKYGSALFFTENPNLETFAKSERCENAASETTGSRGLARVSELDHRGGLFLAAPAARIRHFVILELITWTGLTKFK